MMQQSGLAGSSINDEGSYTSSSSGSCSEVEPDASASQSLAGHIEDASTSPHSRPSYASGKPLAARALAVHTLHDGDEQEVTGQSSTPTMAPEGSQTAQAAAFIRPPDQVESKIEKADLLERSEVIRRLSQSVLAMSNNTLTHSTDEDWPHVVHRVAAGQIPEAAAARRKASSASPAAVSGRYESEEPGTNVGANDAPSSAQQSSTYRGQALTQDLDRPGGKQARLQLEDMLTRIELHFQAEKSARLEAEAHCAAALEALRCAGHPDSMPSALPAPRQLPDSVIDSARKGITAARSLVASVCTVLEELETVRQSALHIQATMDDLLQELPDTSAGQGVSQGHDSVRAERLSTMYNAQPQAVQPGRPQRLQVGLESAAAAKSPSVTRSMVQASKSSEEHSNLEEPGIASASHMPAQFQAGMGRVARGRTGIADAGPVQRGIPVHLTPARYEAITQQSNSLKSTNGPKHRSGPPVASARDVSPHRKQLEQPQRWETSTKFLKGI